MEVFKPIKVENYQFMDSGLNQYEPLLLYIRDAGWSSIEVDREGLGLEKRIEKLEEGFRKIEVKVERYMTAPQSLGRIKVEVREQIKLEKQQRQIKLDKIREMVELGADRVQVTILLYLLHRSLALAPAIII